MTRATRHAFRRCAGHGDASLPGNAPSNPLGGARQRCFCLHAGWTGRPDQGQSTMPSVRRWRVSSRRWPSSPSVAAIAGDEQQRWHRASVVTCEPDPQSAVAKPDMDHVALRRSTIPSRWMAAAGLNQANYLRRKRNGRRPKGIASSPRGRSGDTTGVTRGSPAGRMSTRRTRGDRSGQQALDVPGPAARGRRGPAGGAAGETPPLRPFRPGRAPVWLPMCADDPGRTRRSCATKPTTMTSSAAGGSGVSPMNRMTIQVATQNLTENRKPNRDMPNLLQFRAELGTQKRLCPVGLRRSAETTTNSLLIGRREHIQFAPEVSRRLSETLTG